MDKVLQGVRVIDFGRYIAGPFCAALLGDLGADVIRVERVDGGEDRFVVPVADDGAGGMYLQCNRNKRGMTLNPRKPEGREILRRLVANADVVVANLPPAALKAIGLDYDSLKSIKPDIILTTVTAFGSGGPWSDKVGFDGLAQAMSGNLHMSGEANMPTRAFVPYTDYGTAAFSALSTMAALLHRTKTGEGQVLEGALLKTALTFMDPTLIEQHHLQLDRTATINRSPLAGPADTFETRDGWVMCVVVGGPQFERWCRLTGGEAFLDDPRFKDDIGRGDHGKILSAHMTLWCANRTTDEVLSALEEAKLPAGPVYSPQQALDDAHVQQLGFLKQVSYAGTFAGAQGTSPVADYPVSLSATPGTIRNGAPQLGQHTDEILVELGYDTTDIQRMRDARVV